MAIRYIPKKISDVGNFMAFLFDHIRCEEDILIAKDVLPLVIRADCQKCGIYIEIPIEESK